MAKYNIGDKVRIVSERTLGFNSSGKMDKWLGKVMTVNEVLYDGHYCMKEDAGEWMCGELNGWSWGDAMIKYKIDDETINKEEHKMKFKVGDIVKANELSNDEYAFTTLKNEWTGEVVKVYDTDDEYADNFKAITTHHKNGEFIGDYFDLNSKYFDLVEETESKPAKENKSTYNVGDKVKIRKDLEDGKVYGVDSFVDNMEEYKGRVATIKRVKDNGSYIIDLDCGAWFWTPEMFECKVDEVETVEPTETTEVTEPTKKTVSKKFTKGVDVDLVQDMYRTVTDPKTKQVTFSPVKMVHLVFVQFDGNDKVYTFNNPTDTRLKKGVRVLVDTRFGEKIATVVTSIKIQKKYLKNLMVAMGNDSALKDVLGTVETVKETITHEKVKRFDEPKHTKKVFSAKKFAEVEGNIGLHWDWVELLDGKTTDEIDELGYAWDETWLVEVAA